MSANIWTLLVLFGIGYIGWHLRTRKGFQAPKWDGLPAPSIHDDNCPVCGMRIPGPLSTFVECSRCQSTWNPHDFVRQGKLVCSECNEPMIQRIQDPYDSDLWQVTFKCGRVVACHCLGDKKEMVPCAKKSKPIPEGPDKSPETVPTKQEVIEYQDTYQPGDYEEYADYLSDED